MKHIHVHVSVENLPESIRFYSTMFGGAEPTVLKDDYCKWELKDPAVNFAISQRGAKPGIDHLGIQVETDEELVEMNARFAAANLPVMEQTGTTCCYAKSDKAWTVDPGASQGSCRLGHAANGCISADSECVLTTESRSGFRVTAPMGVQFRVVPDQRRGFRSRALRYTSRRAARIAVSSPA